jgi:hypothetical protein
VESLNAMLVKSLKLTKRFLKVVPKRIINKQGSLWHYFLEIPIEYVSSENTKTSEKV